MQMLVTRKVLPLSREAITGMKHLTLQTTGLNGSPADSQPGERSAGFTPIVNGSAGADDLRGLICLLLKPTHSKPRIRPTSPPGWQDGYNQLMMKPEGVLYEDAQMQIGVRSEFRQQMGCLILYYQNKSPYSIGSFTTSIENAV